MVLKPRPLNLLQPIPFGSILQSLRIEKGFTRNDVLNYLQLCGLPYETTRAIRSWEAEGCSPSMEVLCALSELYGTNVFAPIWQAACNRDRKDNRS